MVQLDVDSEVNHVVGPLNPKPVDHREPVFVGGVPGKGHLKRDTFPNPRNGYVLITVLGVRRAELRVLVIHLTTQGALIYRVLS